MFFCFYQIIALSDCFLSSSVLILLLFLRGIFQNIHKASWPLFLVEKQLPSCLQLQLSSPSSWIRHCSSCCRHCNHLPRRHSSFYRRCKKNVGLTNVDLTNVATTNVAIFILSTSSKRADHQMVHNNPNSKQLLSKFLPFWKSQSLSYNQECFRFFKSYLSTKKPFIPFPR